MSNISFGLFQAAVNDASDGDVAWTNPNGARFNDNDADHANFPVTHASAVLTAIAPSSQYLKMSDPLFNRDAPLTSTIKGVIVRICTTSVDGNPDIPIQGIWLVIGGAKAGDNKAGGQLVGLGYDGGARPGIPASGGAAYSVQPAMEIMGGGQDDLWGLGVITPAQFNDIGVIVQIGPVSGDRTPMIDSIQIVGYWEDELEAVCTAASPTTGMAPYSFHADGLGSSWGRQPPECVEMRWKVVGPGGWSRTFQDPRLGGTVQGAVKDLATDAVGFNIGIPMDVPGEYTVSFDMYTNDPVTNEPVVTPSNEIIVTVVPSDFDNIRYFSSDGDNSDGLTPGTAWNDPDTVVEQVNILGDSIELIVADDSVFVVPLRDPVPAFDGVTNFWMHRSGDGAARPLFQQPDGGALWSFANCSDLWVEGLELTGPPITVEITGVWNSSRPYVVDDIARKPDTSNWYRCIQANTNVVWTDTDFWELFNPPEGGFHDLLRGLTRATFVDMGCTDGWIRSGFEFSGSGQLTEQLMLINCQLKNLRRYGLAHNPGKHFAVYGVETTSQIFMVAEGHYRQYVGGILATVNTAFTMLWSKMTDDWVVERGDRIAHLRNAYSFQVHYQCYSRNGSLATGGGENVTKQGLDYVKVYDALCLDGTSAMGGSQGRHVMIRNCKLVNPYIFGGASGPTELRLAMNTHCFPSVFFDATKSFDFIEVSNSENVYSSALYCDLSVRGCVVAWTNATASGKHVYAKQGMTTPIVGANVPVGQWRRDITDWAYNVYGRLRASAGFEFQGAWILGSDSFNDIDDWNGAESFIHDDVADASLIGADIQEDADFVYPGTPNVPPAAAGPGLFKDYRGIERDYGVTWKAGATGAETGGPPAAPVLSYSPTTRSLTTDETAAYPITNLGGGSVTYVLDGTSEALQTGLSLAANGSIIGTPTETGVRIIVARGTNVSGFDTATITITVTPGGAADAPFIHYAGQPLRAYVGVPFSADVIDEGDDDDDPPTYSLVSGSFPAGIDVTPSGPNRGRISGTP